jgi:CRP/FNR family transcriptional regulator, cyclic AMP receptor protein
MLGHAVHPSAGETPSSSDEIRTILGQLGLRGRRTTLSKGGMMSLHEGPHTGLHLLVRGRMKTVRFSEKGRVMILDLLDAGDVFGEMSLIDELGSEPTFAEALQVVEIESIPRFVVERALTGRPALAIAVARLMGARRNRLEGRLGTHVFLRVRTRLVFLLLELAERFGEAVPSPSRSSAREARRFVLDIPLSQQDLGNLIGASREIVSLTLSEFRRRGAVSMLGRRMVIEPDRLRFEATAKDS